MTTPNIQELMERMRLLESDHKPHGWPAIQMRDISALLDALQSQAERIKELEAYNRTRTDELVASVEQCAGLRAQLAALQVDDELPEPINRDETEHGTDYYTADQLRQHAAQVRAKMVPLEKDAARLDWLVQDRQSRVFHIVNNWYTRKSYGMPWTKRKDLRAAIDAAMGITGEPK